MHPCVLEKNEAPLHTVGVVPCCLLRILLIVIVMNIVRLAIFTAGIIISMCTATRFGAIMSITAVYHRVFLVAASVFTAPVSATVRTAFFGFKVAVAQNAFIAIAA